MNKISRILPDLFDRFEQNGVDYCILHDFLGLPEKIPPDLDIAVPLRKLHLLEKVLREYEKARIVQVLRHEASCFYFVLALREGNEIRFIAIDAATDYRKNGFIFFSSDELLAGRKRWKCFWVSSAPVEFAYLLVKRTLKGVINYEHKKRLSDLLQELSEQANPIAQRLFGRNVGSKVISWIEKSEWANFDALSSQLKYNLFFQNIRKNPLTPFRYWIAESVRVVQRWFQPTGLVIGVLGPDGTGKTTLIRHMRKELSKAFRGMEIFHFRPALIRWGCSESATTEPHGKSPHPFMLSLAKIPYFVLDYIIGYAFIVRPKLARSTMIMFDRYYDDLLVDPRRYRYDGPKWTIQLGKGVIPSPGLFLLLDVPENKLVRRKNEVAKKELTRQRSEYLKMIAGLPNAIVINGEADAKQVSDKAGEVVLSLLHARYVKRRFYWFGRPKTEVLSLVLSKLITSPEMGRFSFSRPEKCGGVNDSWEMADSYDCLLLNNDRGCLIPRRNPRLWKNALEMLDCQNPRLRLGKELLGLGLRLGISSPLLRRVYLCHRASISEKEKRSIFLLEQIKRIMGKDSIACTISLGNPGFHRKPVIQIHDSDGTVIGYAKLGWNEATIYLVQNEVDSLSILAANSIKSFAYPRLIYSGWWKDCFLCLQTSLKGKARQAPFEMTSEYMGVVQELASVKSRCMPLEQSAFWLNIKRRANEVPSPFAQEILIRSIDKIETFFEDRGITFHMAHGDLTPWNAKIGNGCLYIFDWEYSGSQLPPGWDLIRFLVQTLWLIQKSSPAELWEAFDSGGFANQLIERYLVSLGMDGDSVVPLLAIYLVDWLSFYVKAEPENFRALQYLTMMLDLYIHK